LATRSPAALAALVLTVTALSGCTSSGEGGEAGPSTSVRPATGPQLSGNVSDLASAGSRSITGSGFQPGAKAELLICGPASVGDAARDHCDYRTGRAVDVDTDGSIRADVMVREFINLGEREINCLEVECSVATTGSGGARILSRLPISWTEEVELPPAPTLAAVLAEKKPGPWSPARITGSGFTPNTPISIVQCPSDGHGGIIGDHCVSPEIAPELRSDAAGRLRGTASVALVFQRPDGERVDCVQMPICRVAVLPSKRYPGQRIAIGPIDFRAAR
jgi:hypothetical protein